ncbi:dimethyl sulfoxide reductase anchor subunit family protein [Consotaella salsifontis]|uniref:Anaerobic dimethyl sulfoxide reductase subunit C (DMSO reductase anchor subunit)/Tat-targeted selenate reductase subunit YnfH n=1 Tax=Consotaella salsifontis TaxID=1365950 RepID=A0A1T4SP35_9HYPH|nr:DmsC/YnfH family molybdoenzyme membrane anchor subunit [Consotaella salsifontis]SKA29942.1 anaerobic dimethyl sulfoxide reductase subunit C (DMSO reductase anchor subunit)/Tat-targeted selenate reductase subunit YnfH [Consotaella salsifontis]
MGWNEWPLMLFTVLAQSAIGAYWLCAFALFTERRDVLARRRLERLMIVVWVVLGAAFLSSTAHVGSPMRGANVLLRVGQAPLSNELFFGMSFIAVGGIAWLLSLFADSSRTLRNALYLLALVLSIALLWNMTRFYLMPTVPTWNTPLTPVAFVVTAVLGGAMLANLLFALAGLASRRLDRLVAAVAVLGLIGGVVAAVVLITTLPGIQTSVHAATSMSPDMGMWQAARFLLLFAAVALVLGQVIVGRRVLPVMVVALLLVLGGEIIGRGVFYALHMTVGLV